MLFLSRAFVWGNFLISLGSVACTAAVGSIDVFSVRESNKVMHCLHPLLHMPLCCAICYFPVAICYAQQCWIHISILKTFTNVLLFASKLIVDTHFLMNNKAVHTVVWEYYYLSFNILNIFWTQAPGSSILSFFGIVTALSCAKHTILYFNHDPHYHFSPCAGSSEYDCRLGQPQTSYSNIRNNIMKIYCNTLCIHSVI